MTDNAKVQGYVVKFAVMALAFADVATYFVLNRHIHEPVPTKEGFADSLEASVPDRSASAVVAQAGSSLLVPAPSSYELGNQRTEVTVPADGSGWAAPVPELEIAALDVPDRAEPAAAAIPRQRISGPDAPAAPRRAQTRAFARAFSSYPVAKIAELASACAAVAVDAANYNCPVAQPDLAADDAELVQSSATPEFNQVPTDRSPELPALIGGPATPESDDKIMAEPVPQNRDRGSAAERISAKPAVTPALYEPQGHSDPAAMPKSTATAMDIQTDVPTQMSNPVAAEFTRRLPKAATTATIARPASRSAPPKVIGASARQPLTGARRDIRAMALVSHFDPHPAQSPTAALRQADRTHMIPGMPALATASAGIARPDQVRGVALSPASVDGAIALCLRDVLIAVRPLMGSNEFERLMRSRHSGAMISLTTLAKAGIFVRYDRATNEVSFS